MKSCVHLMRTQFNCDITIAEFYELTLTEALRELVQGDIKYGPHPGPKRAFGALRAELAELQTELEAEDASPESIHKEAIQVHPRLQQQ